MLTTTILALVTFAALCLTVYAVVQWRWAEDEVAELKEDADFLTDHRNKVLADYHARLVQARERIVELNCKLKEQAEFIADERKAYELSADVRNKVLQATLQKVTALKTQVGSLGWVRQVLQERIACLQKTVRELQKGSTQ